MDPASNESVGCVVRVPSHWKTFDVIAQGAASGTNAGDVVLRLTYSARSLGDSVNAGISSTSLATLTAGAQYILQEQVVATNLTALPTGYHMLRLDRRAADAGDTLADDYAITGLILRRAS
jgi:hypothetical protein